ncbi:MAG: NADH-quinone oxidoreductase subunit C [Chloroflexota bacterium]
MTVALSVKDTASKLEARFSGSVISSADTSLLVKGDQLAQIASFLKSEPGLEFDYLNSIIGTDYWYYFEVVYILTSLKHNHGLVLKTRCYGRENLKLPSVVSVWRGADFQEREIYDLLGISFEGHPNMKRIVTWEGFPGHPLRRDFLEW